MGPDVSELFVEGLNLCREGAVDRAAECFARVLEGDAGHVRARYNLAYCRFLQERFEESSREFEVLLRQCPGDADIYNNMGKIHLRNGDTGAALEAFRKAAVLDPLHADALCQAGIVLGKHFGNVAEAIELLEKAVELNDRLAEGHQALAVCYHHLGRINEGIRHLQRALQLDTNNAAAHNHLGIMYLKVREDAEAEKHFKEALTIDPTASLRHRNLWDI